MGRERERSGKSMRVHVMFTTRSADCHGCPQSWRTEKHSKFIIMNAEWIKKQKTIETMSAGSANWIKQDKHVIRKEPVKRALLLTTGVQRQSKVNGKMC